MYLFMMQDVAKFFLCSGLVQLIMFFTLVPSFFQSHASARSVLLQLLLALLGAAPPCLAAVLVVVRIVSLIRLQRRGLIVSHIHKMLTAGHLDVVLFDKTGTLTSEQVNWLFLLLLLRQQLLVVPLPVAVIYMYVLVIAKFMKCMSDLMYAGT